ncbi:MAG: hypothetical protein IPM52_14545 [Bacteroidetes bacterium]|nr:hypothetical protein [Bacteroidota bacterium]
MTTGFHAGPIYDTETQQQLDRLFESYLSLDQAAAQSGYENAAANKRAEDKHAEYALAKEIADRIYASDEADKLEPVIRQGLRAQFGQREAVQ